MNPPAGHAERDELILEHVDHRRGAADEDVLVAQPGGQPGDVRGAHKPEPVPADGRDSKPRDAIGDVVELVEEIALVTVLHAVVEVDLVSSGCQAARHAQKRRQTDAPGDPHLARVVHGEIGEAAVRPVSYTHLTLPTI